MALSSTRFKFNPRLVLAAEDNPPLQFGEKGEAVRLIQEALIGIGYWMPKSTDKYFNVDGKYGLETVKTIKNFQRGAGLSDDGRVGRETLKELEAQIWQMPNHDIGFTHRLRLHLRSIGRKGNPLRSFDLAQEIFAGYGIQVIMGSMETVNLPTDKQLLLSIVNKVECPFVGASDEQHLLHKLGFTKNIGLNDITAYFIDEIRNSLGLETAVGCAGHATSRAAVMVSSGAQPTTLAHEIGHVLLGPHFFPVHETDPDNLMRSGILSMDRRQLNENQLKQMKKSRFLTQIRPKPAQS
ncbi:MAG: peptidoglycan-binding protein [Burkholderiaceae bacterium]|nr:peptidoglycan-binding protein [Burkholderiaceae bacterium]